jgi:hypothetical protein
MTSTSTLFGPEFAKNTVNMFLNAVDEGTKQAARIFWDILKSFLIDHWLAVIVVLFIILVIAIFRAIMGRWGMLGHVLYNYLYFGVLFVIGLIWGPEVFVNNFFNVACTIIFYPVCYIVVGLILDKVGVRRF